MLRYATILLEASHVPATLATLLVLIEDHVWVSEHNEIPNQNRECVGLSRWCHIEVQKG